MINIKLDEDKRGKVIFRANIDECHKEDRILKRALFESRVVNNEFKYNIPMKYFWPILNNMDKKILSLSEDSKKEVLEFADEYEEVYYYSYKATPAYMKKWREEGCPQIFKMTINPEDLSIEKKVIFERLI
ncbi:hypothetical protein QYB59_000866 [Clostridium perfringens]|nr:hypothetical protein [Clostridium perfringens]MDZ4991737.1 hypothetical protein [Clostridium perfringens]